MELKYLRTFQAAANYLNFTKAAQHLGFTQPTVTTQIQNLEYELGKTLFLRVGRRTFLTPTGELVKKYADEILSLVDEMELTILKSSNENKLLRIAAAEYYCALNLPSIISRFTKEFPNIQISLVSCESSVVKEGIETNKFDIGIVSGELRKSGIENTFLGEEELQLIVSKNLFEKYTIEELFEHFPYIEYDAQGLVPSLMKQVIEKLKFSPKRIIQMGSERAIKKAVLNDMGIALLCSNLVKEEVKTGDIAVIDILEPQIKIETFLIAQKDKFYTKEIQSFCNVIVSNWNNNLSYI